MMLDADGLQNIYKLIKIKITQERKEKYYVQIQIKNKEINYISNDLAKAYSLFLIRWT